MAKDYIEQSDEDEIIESEDRGDTFEDEDEDVEVEDESTEEDVPDEEEAEEDDEVNPYQERIDALIRQQEEQAKANKWLQDQLEKLIGSKDKPIKEPEPTFDYEGAEETYAQLLIENEFAKAAKLRVQIDSARRAEMLELIQNTSKDTDTKAKAYSSEAVLEREFQSLIDNLETTHDFLNPKSKKYNAEAVETINTLMAGYAASGSDKVSALKLAVKKATPLYATPIVSKSVGDTRKQAAGKKAAAAAKSQPIKTRSTTVPVKDNDVVDVFKMSDKDFNKLTDKERRQLRGDF